MRSLLDMLYPRNCIGCGRPSPETYRFICWDCWAATARIEAPFCARCGDPVAGAVDHDFTCYLCAAAEPHFDGARSVARYDGVVGEALRLLKYHNGLWLAPDLARALARCLQAEYPDHRFDCIVPVPLHHVRRRERGYNQSVLLARELGCLLKVPTTPRMLRRIRPTATQTNLTASRRLSNVHNAFEPGKARLPDGLKVLLVDDVMTTGATVNACARALRKGGAASVHAVTVARG